MSDALARARLLRELLKLVGDELAPLESLHALTTKASQPWYADEIIDPKSPTHEALPYSAFLRAGDDEVDDTFITDIHAGMHIEDAKFCAAAHTRLPQLIQLLRAVEDLNLADLQRLSPPSDP